LVTGAPAATRNDDEPPPTMTDPNGEYQPDHVPLLEELKTKAEEVARGPGSWSLNSFVSQAVQGALYNAGRGRGGGGGRTRTGRRNWGQLGSGASSPVTTTIGPDARARFLARARLVEG